MPMRACVRDEESIAGYVREILTNYFKTGTLTFCLADVKELDEWMRAIAQLNVALELCFRFLLLIDLGSCRLRRSKE